MIVGRLPTILLALVLAFANAFCACAGVGVVGGQADRVTTMAPSPHGGCHGHAAVSSPVTSCHSSAREDGGGTPCGDTEHSCPHCTGVVVADALSATKSSVAQPVQPPVLLVSIFWAVPKLTEVVLGQRPLHSGLPPPVERPTLLNLSCSLTT